MPDRIPPLDPPVALIEADLPDFGEPDSQPQIPDGVYANRIERLHSRMRAAGLDALVVYGDREHMANVAWATGYDPRFEECLAVVFPERRTLLLVGNEGWAYAGAALGPFDRELYQSFSLMAQPRGNSRPLTDILAGMGLSSGQRLGAAGWKYFGPDDRGLPDEALEIPAYIADAIRGITGPDGSVVNAGALFMDPVSGLRAINEVEQLAVFEHAATLTSQALRRAIDGLRPGLREVDAVRLMQLNGMPLSAHLMLSSGPRAALGLPSPSWRVIGKGEPLTMAFGLQGGLNARAGFVVGDDRELPAESRGYVDKLVAPYYAAVVAWWQALGIGVTGGELWRAVHSRIGDPFFGVSLNPGHLIHLDEWLHSPVFRDSPMKLQSGLALQCDIIPATGTPWFTSNAEDGLALADAPLRREFRIRYPEAWRRISARRDFMTRVLGIRLRPEVLPFSNIPAVVMPYLLAPRRMMAVRR